MDCPYCASDSTVVLDSRSTAEGIRRRRVCNECKRRFTTYEKVGVPSLRVQKRSGHTESFDRSKLLTCLARVCRHRPVTKEDLERVGRDIEARLIDTAARSITSGQIATLAITRLAELDRLAHDRLAVNYVDEDGQLRTEHREKSDRSQMGLFGGATES